MLVVEDSLSNNTCPSTSSSRHRYLPPIRSSLQITPRIAYSVSCDVPTIVLLSVGEQLAALVTTLEACEVFGFDVEAHNARTFHGLTCLLQISTQQEVTWRGLG